MGLGLLGRGVGDVEFFAECGAELIVTDLKDEKELAPSLRRLRQFKNVTYVLGKHRLEDFKNHDFILKAAGVPLDSPYIAEARKNDIPIEMDASLFFKLMPEGVIFIGVTGTRGKSTVTHLIYHILKAAKRRVFLAGNVKDTATLPLLRKVKKGDVVVAELDSWQLQGFGPTSLKLRGASDLGISPHISVFTTFLDDHMNYYKADRARYFKDKANIFKYQKPTDTLVVREGVYSLVKDIAPSKIVVARKKDVPDSWKIKLLGEHNRENVACAMKVSKTLGISSTIIKKAVELFKGVPGRLEYLRTVRLPATRGSAQAGGVKIYNDNSATTPDATLVALRTLGGKASKSDLKAFPPCARQKISQNIVLIAGGTDKGFSMTELAKEIPKYCKAAILLKESGTEKLLATSCQLLGKDFKKLSAKSYQLKATKAYLLETLEECVETAMKLAKKGDIVLFSPAFASFGKWFQNEYDRGTQFIKIVESL